MNSWGSAMNDKDPWEEYRLDAWTESNSTGCAWFEWALIIALVVVAMAVIYWGFIPAVKSWSF